MLLFDPRIGGLFSARYILISGACFFIVSLIFLPSTPAQAGLAGFMIGAGLWLYAVSRGQLKTVSAQRIHQPRVFEGDSVSLALRVRRGPGLPIQMLEVQDQFLASFHIRQEHLIPLLAPGWEVQLHYSRPVEHHRGLYLIGPVKIRTADPLGVFFTERELDCMTKLTVYPKADPLPGYCIPGPQAPAGASLDRVTRIGQGEEVLGVREYIAGDPPTRVHWRTSARRGKLHVVQLNCPIQVEVAVMVDLTRRSRLGLGMESTTEMAIRAAVSILSKTHEARHRFSLGYVQQEAVFFPAGSGMGHLHLLLDKLAMLNPIGEGDFWEECGRRALMLPAGARAVFIVSTINTPLKPAQELIKKLCGSGIEVDFVLLDEREFIKIFKDQEKDIRSDQPAFEEYVQTLTRAGARIYPIRRGQGVAQVIAQGQSTPDRV